MFERNSVRSAMVALLTTVGLFAATSAHADIVSVSVYNGHNLQQAYGGSNANSRIAITLDAPAGPTGQVISLSSTSANLHLSKSSVKIPAGQTSYIFGVASTPNVIPTAEVDHIFADDGNGAVSSNDYTVLPMEARFSAGPTTSMMQGSSNLFTVKMSANVRAQQTVTVTSDNGGVSVANAVVAINQPYGTFTANVSDAATGSATITLSFNGRSVTRTLAIKPIAVKMVVPGASSVTGGNGVSVTVTLTAPAPASGRTVSLSYVGPVGMGSPTSAVVTSGNTEVTFTVPTMPVASGTKTLTVKASLGGVTKSCQVSVSH